MCGKCKVDDALSIYDKKCFRCKVGNPYYEVYNEPIDNERWKLWRCSEKDMQYEPCQSINFLPDVECRNCKLKN